MRWIRSFDNWFTTDLTPENLRGTSFARHRVFTPFGLGGGFPRPRLTLFSPRPTCEPCGLNF